MLLSELEFGTTSDPSPADGEYTIAATPAAAAATALVAAVVVAVTTTSIAGVSTNNPEGSLFLMGSPSTYE